MICLASTIDNESPKAGIAKMGTMFQTWNIGQIEIKNRLVRSATVEGLSMEDGKPTQRLIEKITDFAFGGVGMIIAGAAYISLDGQADKILPDFIMTMLSSH